MAEIWIQLENRPWDTMPNDKDRMTGRNAQAITSKASEIVTITLPAPSRRGAYIRRVWLTRIPAPPASGDVMVTISEALLVIACALRPVILSLSLGIVSQGRFSN